MLEDRKQRGVQSTLDILFLTFVFGFLFLVEALGGVCFEVDLDRVHAVDALLVPWCLLVEDWPQLTRKPLILLEVLDEVCDHELIVKNEDWEMQLAPLVKRDVLICDLR